jgi:hypothetical protein
VLQGQLQSVVNGAAAAFDHVEDRGFPFQVLTEELDASRRGAALVGLTGHFYLAQSGHFYVGLTTIVNTK